MVTWNYDKRARTLTISGVGYMEDGLAPWHEYKIEKIIIENGVKNIESFAFSGCSGLTSVTIPDSVTSIGDDAFRWCSSLTSVTIPDSVTNIEYSAFGLPFEKHENLTIHGKPGSKAQIFATEHGIKFESI